MASRPQAQPLDGLGTVVSRILLLVFWALVLWGTLVAGGILWNVLTLGWKASRGLLHPHGWEGWSNALLAPFALAVWGCVFLTMALREGSQVRGPGGER
jgi:hypothetical protein